MAKKPFVNFDNPRLHLGGIGHYTVPKARTPEEIERRRALPNGTVMAEHQLHGTKFAQSVFDKLAATGEAPDLHYATGVLAVSALNTSWYAYARYAPDVTRRRQRLVEVVDDETGERMTPAELRDDIAQSFDGAVMLGEAIVLDRSGGHAYKKRDTAFGRHVGDMSLKLSALHHNVTAAGGNAFEVSEQVRAAALLTLEEARTLGTVIGTHPSLAQFASQDSDLSVSWRRQAPNGARDAMEATVAEIGYAPL